LFRISQTTLVLSVVLFTRLVMSLFRISQTTLVLPVVLFTRLVMRLFRISQTPEIRLACWVDLYQQFYLFI